MILSGARTALLALLLAGCQSVPALAAPESAPPKSVIEPNRVASVQSLERAADEIVFGRFDSADREQETGRKVRGGRLVNFVQTLHVKTTLKGKPERLLRVVTTGIEPLPDVTHPLNSTYPGPLFEGEYVCFLKKLKGTDYYALVGGWQGVYPVEEGKTYAFEEAGFRELAGLSLDDLAKKLKRQ
ncbi:hypothetical protein [Paenibacillus flagellatus]|uniref:Uncharacterized protein n=1 Tax=Paenibacillus flagellatus TaxID=2211139 RepID=A0A2V5K9T4_9BACL|nr:hypothetical protein [Paenibacillus flagellatus]PYI54804.1 hypothetical protein DLM86_09615 [Paenibacillus flagellatus]